MSTQNSTSFRLAGLSLAVFTLACLVLPAQDASMVSPFPRGQALSGACTAYVDGVEAIRYNPALSVYGPNASLYINYSSWIDTTSLFSLAGRMRLSPQFSVGLLATLFLAGGIETTGAGENPFSLNPLGIWVPTLGDATAFTEWNLAANAAYELSIGKVKLPLGGNLRVGHYQFLGEGKTRLAVDLGTMLDLHEAFRVAERIPSALARGIIPERFAVTSRNLGVEASGVADLQSDFTAPEVVFALGFRHVAMGNLDTKRPFGWKLSSEFDVSTLQGFSMGLLNQFRIGEIRPELLLGMNYTGDAWRFSGGLHASFRVLQMEYYVSYSLRALGTLPMVHSFSFGANFDINVLAKISKRTAVAKEDGQARLLAKARSLLENGSYREALALLEPALKKNPAHVDLKNLTEKARGLLRSHAPEAGAAKFPAP